VSNITTRSALNNHTLSRQEASSVDGHQGQQLQVPLQLPELGLGWVVSSFLKVLLNLAQWLWSHGECWCWKML